VEIDALFSCLPDFLALRIIFSEDYFECYEHYCLSSSTSFTCPFILKQIGPSIIVAFKDIASFMDTRH